MSLIEFNLMKRKALREKGEFIPKPPTQVKAVRTHFHTLNSMQQKKNKMVTSE